MLLGYDNNLKRYDSMWIDSMGTGMMVTHSKTDSPAELTGEFYCPMVQKEVTARLVNKNVSNDEHVFEMYSPGPDGKESPDDADHVSSQEVGNSSLISPRSMTGGAAGRAKNFIVNFDRRCIEIALRVQVFEGSLGSLNPFFILLHYPLQPCAVFGEQFAAICQQLVSVWIAQKLRQFRQLLGLCRQVIECRHIHQPQPALDRA